MSLCGLGVIETIGQSKIGKNCEGYVDSVDTFFQDDH